MYNSIFIELPKPKEVYINEIVYCLVYVIHMIYYKIFT